MFIEHVYIGFRDYNLRYIVLYRSQYMNTLFCTTQCTDHIKMDIFFVHEGHICRINDVQHEPSYIIIIMQTSLLRVFLVPHSLTFSLYVIGVTKYMMHA